MLQYHRQQRSLTHPVLVHCLGGSGRTALVLLLAAAFAEVEIGSGSSDDANCDIVPDLVSLAGVMCKQRKGVLKEKEYLRQAYQGVATYCKEVLIKHGVVQPDSVPQNERLGIITVHVVYRVNRLNRSFIS